MREARQVSKSMASSNAPPYKATGLQDKITHPSTDQSAEITVPPAPPIANEDDHDSVRFWKKSEWRNFEESERKRNRNTVKFSFICDEFGESVASSRIDEIGDAAKLAWNELHHFRLAPTTWAKKIDRANEYFSNTMRTKFPELRLCQGDWKLQEFATERYPAWCRYSRDGKSGGLSRCVIFFLQFFFLLSLSLGARPSIRTIPSRKRKADNEDSNTIQNKRKKKKTHINKTPPPAVNVIDDNANDSDVLSYVDEVPHPVDPPHRGVQVETESNVPSPPLSTSLSPSSLSAPLALPGPPTSSNSESTLVSSAPRSFVFPPSSLPPSPTLMPENNNSESIQPYSPIGNISDTTTPPGPSVQGSMPEVPPSSLVAASTPNSIHNGGHQSPDNQPTVVSSFNGLPVFFLFNNFI